MTSRKAGCYTGARMDFRVCIDVADLDRALAFYTAGFGLRVGRRFGDDAAELLGGPAPIDLLRKAAGSRATPDGNPRGYGRHWTPVHLDLVVKDAAATVAKLVELGATLESGPEDKPWGRIALLADPFGHGLCVLEFRGAGYDEIA